MARPIHCVRGRGWSSHRARLRHQNRHRLAGNGRTVRIASQRDNADRRCSTTTLGGRIRPRPAPCTCPESIGALCRHLNSNARSALTLRRTTATTPRSKRPPVTSFPGRTSAGVSSHRSRHSASTSSSPSRSTPRSISDRAGLPNPSGDHPAPAQQRCLLRCRRR